MLCNWLESNAESGIFTVSDLHSKMEMLKNEFGDPSAEVFHQRYLKDLLIEKYGDEIYLTNETRRKDVLCFKDLSNKIIRDYHNKDINKEDEELEIIKTAIKLLKNRIKSMKLDPTVYPSKHELTADYKVPETLQYFIDQFTASPEQTNLWKQMFVKAVRPRSGPMPYLLALGIQLDHKYGSKWLNQRMSKLGFCEGPDELYRYKWSYLQARQNSDDSAKEVAMHERIIEQIEKEASEYGDEDEHVSSGSEHSEEDTDSEISFTCEPTNTETIDATHEPSCEQYVGDNVDINIRSLQGNTSFHAMGRIRVVTPAPERPEENEILKVSRKKLTAEEKRDILCKLDIRIQPFQPKVVNSLSSIKFAPLSVLQKKVCYSIPTVCNSIWTSGWIIKLSTPEFLHCNWKGFNKSIHEENKSALSQISYLPIINSKPDSFSTVYTTITECIKSAKSEPLIITFDFPLWVKAIRIVLEMNLPVIVRLGGFHLLKSYLGSLGYIMKDSGLEELFQCIYPGSETVDKIMSGGAYYKSLRAHFLVDAALCAHILEGEFSDEELEEMKLFIVRCKEEKLGSKCSNRITQFFDEKINKKLSELAKKGRSAKLWMNYHSQVMTIKNFILAERLHNHDQHLATVVDMLPTFAAAGHTQYAKGARLYVQLMQMNSLKYAPVKSIFNVHKLHTVRYNKYQWSGIWTDLTIEQTLMRAIKSRGGLTQGKLRNQKSGYKIWVSLLDHFSSVNQALSDLKNKSVGSEQKVRAVIHADLTPSSMKKDFTVFKKAYDWMVENLCLDQETDVLMSFSTGLFSKEGDKSEEVNADCAFEVGTSIQQSLDGGCFTDKMSSKCKVKNLAHLQKPVRVSAETSVTVDSLILFNRLSGIAQRELTLSESLAYELTQMPLSLFDHKQQMRKPNKAALAKHLKGDITATESPASTKLIIDGGWLLYQCSFASGESYGSITQKYLRFVKEYKKDVTVVFDGYNPSPKDHDHKRRSKYYSSNIILNQNTPCTVSRARFLSNSHNKTQLILLLSDVLQSNGVEVLHANDDADTLIAKTAIRYGLNKDVEVRVEDTDVICLLVHHCIRTNYKVYITTMHGTYDVKEIRENLPSGQLEILLFSHSFSGCDTVSNIYGFGKVKVLKKLCHDNAPQDVINTFKNIRASKAAISEAGVKLFQYLYNNADVSLNQLRYNKYNKLMAKGVFKPEKLPPTTGAAIQHALRAYLQHRDWLLLESQSAEPREYGWTFSGTFEPVGSMEPIAPSSILEFISCNCQLTTTDNSCANNRCTCKRYGMKCIPACGNCHGLNCSNSAAQEEDDEEFVDENQMEEDN